LGKFKAASDLAKQLNVHTNHLNPAMKEVTQGTTSQLIAQRLLQEAQILLKHSVWSVSEVFYALIISKVRYFNNFFKRHINLNLLKFRNG
jgi:AraC family transcriptional activator of pobA